MSRIMQAWRDMAVREKLLRDEESTPFLQRQHYRSASTGFATVGAAAAASAPKGVPASVAAKVRENSTIRKAPRLRVESRNEGQNGKAK